MARPSKTAPVIPSTSLVASAVRYGKKSARIYHKASDNWQGQCYRHYSICGEAQYAAEFFGNALSRAKLSVIGTDGETLLDGAAADALQNLFNGQHGQAQMLKSIGVHLTIAGECFLIGRQPTDEEKKAGFGEVWEVVSVMEVEVTGQKWTIKYDQNTKILLSDDDVVIRIWTPRPGARMEATSPFRSVLPVLNEIEWLTRHIFAQLSSRLAGAGILFLPQGMTFPPPPDQDGEAQQTSNEAEAFMQVLADAMMTPISDPESPSALVPITVTAPDDVIDKARLLTFWTELDSHALELRSEAIRRFALGMNLPPEEILGMSSNGGTGGGNSNGVSHWGAWQIEESTIKMHIEPMLETICNALTIAYLRPLSDDGDERLAYDTAALRLRPDRSREAIELYNLGLVKAEVVLRENGFDPIEDAPEEKEVIYWLLKKVAAGSATPEQVGAALEALGVELNVPEEQGQTRESRPDPSLEEHPSRPRTPEESVAALVAALTPTVNVEPTPVHINVEVGAEGRA